MRLLAYKGGRREENPVKRGEGETPLTKEEIESAEEREERDRKKLEKKERKEDEKLEKKMYKKERREEMKELRRRNEIKPRDLTEEEREQVDEFIN